MHQLRFLALGIFLISAPIANACQPNEYSFSVLTREKWTSIKKIMRNNSMTLDREPVTKSQISSIIGFSGDCDFKGRVESCVWVDRQDCKKKISAKFRDRELATIRKSGF